MGELIVMALLALLVFGPDRLPKVASDAARTLRQVRQMATVARRDLADAAGLEKDPELAQTMRDLRDLDPRRVLTPLDEPGPAASRSTRPGAAPASASPAAGSGNGAGAASGSASGSAAVGHESTSHAPAEGPAGPVGAQPATPSAVDPDWT